MPRKARKRLKGSTPLERWENAYKAEERAHVRYDEAAAKMVRQYQAWQKAKAVTERAAKVAFGVGDFRKSKGKTARAIWEDALDQVELIREDLEKRIKNEDL